MVQFRLLSKGLNKLLCVKNGTEEEPVTRENENKLTALKLQMLLHNKANRKKK